MPADDDPDGFDDAFVRRVQARQRERLGGLWAGRADLSELELWEREMALAVRARQRELALDREQRRTLLEFWLRLASAVWTLLLGCAAGLAVGRVTSSPWWVLGAFGASLTAGVVQLWVARRLIDA